MQQNRMTLREFQGVVGLTDPPDRTVEQLKVRALLGMASEVGEVLDWAKALLEGKFEKADPERLPKELADVLYYVASLANLHNIDLEEAMYALAEANRKRYAEHYERNVNERRHQATGAAT